MVWLDAGIEGVVLDAVGTVIDPDPPVALAYAAAAQRQGIRIPVEEVRRRFHHAFAQDDLHRGDGPLSTDEATERLRWWRIVEQTLPEVPDPDRAFRELWDHFGSAVSWKLYRDWVPVLNILIDHGLRIVIGSNFDSRLRAVVSRMPELHGRVDLVISSEIGWRKPHPAFYLKTFETLALKPHQILWIGDDPDRDLAGPRAVGARSILLDREGRHTGLTPRVTDARALLGTLPTEPTPAHPCWTAHA
jgi:putative hydrolase of the HAD superfamily